MKYLTANKVKDGWLVTIVRTEHAITNDDVYEITRSEGFEVQGEVEEKGNETIYAY